jgi:hypothetical protein
VSYALTMPQADADPYLGVWEYSEIDSAKVGPTERFVIDYENQTLKGRWAMYDEYFKALRPREDRPGLRAIPRNFTPPSSIPGFSDGGRQAADRGNDNGDLSARRCSRYAAQREYALVPDGCARSLRYVTGLADDRLCVAGATISSEPTHETFTPDHAVLRPARTRLFGSHVTVPPRRCLARRGHPMRVL